MNWVLTKTKLWHGWLKGARRSLCGRVTTDNLRSTPARKIQRGSVPTSYRLCEPCRRKANVPLVAPTKGLPGLQDASWKGLVGLHLSHITNGQNPKASHLKIKRLVAKRLALIGPPSDPEARAVYEQLRVLVLTPRRRHGHIVLSYNRVKEAMDMLPPRADQLLHVANTIRLWRHITGQSITPTTGFCPATVIETILALPNPEPYIKQLHARGFSGLAGMFHPNTLDRVKRMTGSLRGAFDTRNVPYWKQLGGQLHIVED